MIIILMHIGLLGSVGDFSIHFEGRNFILSWVPPFHFDTPGPYDIVYCVSGHGVFENRSKSYGDQCGIVAHNYLFENFDTCYSYTITVTPVNQVGRGLVKHFIFPGMKLHNISLQQGAVC